MKSGRIVVIACTVLAVQLAGCASSPPPPADARANDRDVERDRWTSRSSAEPKPRLYLDGQLDIGSPRLVSGNIGDDDRIDYAIVEVVNTLDRGVSVDLIGASHYDKSISDNRTAQLKVAPGSYNVNVSAPGFKPVKSDIRAERNRVVRFEIHVLKSRD